MQIVIDIDENVFTRLFDNGKEDYEIVNDDLFAIAKSIRKGTPLPKGHGRLIDADALNISHGVFVPKVNGNVFGCPMDAVFADEIENAPTIIEADKEE